MSNPIKFTQFPQIQDLHSHVAEIGEIAWVEDVEKYYVATENGWNQVDMKAMSQGIELTAYDMNKQIMAQLPEITPEQRAEYEKFLDDYHLQTDAVFYMLLCKDISYYTVFESDECDFDMFGYPVVKFGQTVLECIDNAGTIVEMHPEDEAVEIWIKLPEGDAVAMYLFAANHLVVPFKGDKYNYVY